MTQPALDITKTIISTEYIVNNIYSLFPDSVFLDKDFQIIGISWNVSHSLGYNIDELNGKSISMLNEGGHFEMTLRNLLKKGYFNDELFPILKKSGGTIKFSVSGFYLGILTESNGVVVLRFVNRDELKELDLKLSEARKYLDLFIYRTAHDLRGPLATMQGLLGLLKMRKDDSDLDRFLQLIEANGNKLDERLQQLVYLATADEEIEEPTYTLRFKELEAELRKIIGSIAYIDFLELVISGTDVVVEGYNEIQVRSILSNLLLYILSLPKSKKNSFIRIFVSFDMDLLIIKIKSEGFTSDPDIGKSFNDINVTRYVDLLKSSNFLYLFAVQKIVVQLHALISVDLLNEDTQQFTLSIPKHERFFSQIPLTNQ
jgi:hypothetical protein